MLKSGGIDPARMGRFKEPQPPLAAGSDVVLGHLKL